MVNGMVKMRRIILTKAVLATIPEMVALRGMRTQEIAEKLGCKVSTLKCAAPKPGSVCDRWEAAIADPTAASALSS